MAGRPVTAVQLLGAKRNLDYTQEAGALVINVPGGLSASPATGFKISFAK
jgi:hypothetical protein